MYKICVVIFRISIICILCLLIIINSTAFLLSLIYNNYCIDDDIKKKGNSINIIINII